MEDRAISVSAFNGYLNRIIAAEELLINISIYGEVCDFSINKNIAYFSVKDEGATLACVCFSPDCFKFLKNGVQVIVTGSPQFYVKGGRFNFKVVRVREYGKGLAYLQFLELKERLEQAGMFARKRPILKLVSKIGVVTSLDGAVIKDIVTIASRRNPYVQIYVANSSVQGALAPAEICRGIKLLDKFGVDVIVVARGGGSGEDLNCFNDEALANTIFNTKTPVVSAVGHETDYTICDFVSDLRAATPSAAAELLTLDLAEYLKGFKKRLSEGVYVLENRLFASECKLKALNNELFYEFSKKFNKKWLNLSEKAKKLIDFENEFLTKKEQKLEMVSIKLQKNNPLEILKCGYAKILKNGRAVCLEDVNINDKIDVILEGGKLIATVDEKIKGER